MIFNPRLARRPEFEAPEYEPFERNDEPVADAPFILDIEGKISKGRTDADGCIEVSIAPSAKQGKLRVHPDTEDEIFMPLTLGTLDPIDTDAGVQNRLNNLGFSCEEGGEMLPIALRLFQEKHGLEMTGEFDDDTKQALQEQAGN